MTNREAEKATGKSRSDGIVKPGALAPGSEMKHEPQSPAGATSEPAPAHAAPTGLDPGDADRSPGADAPGYTMSPVPGWELSLARSPLGATAGLPSSAKKFDESCAVDEAALVDYSDGELSPVETRTLEAHVNQCPRCHQRVAALRASLSIAQNIWHDSAAATVEISPPKHRRRWQPAAAVAGTAAVLIAVLWTTTTDRQSDRLLQPTESVADNPIQPANSNDLPAEWEDLEAIITRQVRSARLAAAARVLAEDPELKPYHDSAQQYLADAFGATDGTGAGQTRAEKGI